MEKSAVPQSLVVPLGRFSQCVCPQDPLSLTFAIWPFLALRGVSREWRVVRGVWRRGEQVGVREAAVSPSCGVSLG